MNVGSIYRASHILPMQPLHGDQDAAQVTGWRGNDRNRDDAGMARIQSVSVSNVNMKGQQLGQLFSVSA